MYLEGTMRNRLKKHFQKNDPLIYQLLDKIETIEKLQPSTDYFSDLCEIIVNQQLSEKAATSIFNRFQKLFPRHKITAVSLLKLSGETIRGAGISWGKVKYLKDLAAKVSKRKVNLKQLKIMPDEQIHKQLIAVKGIGKWSIEMFLMFSLAREDIFSAGDLGLKKAIIKLYKLKKEPSLQQLEKISLKWSPFRTYASRILWRSLDNKKIITKI